MVVELARKNHFTQRRKDAKEEMLEEHRNQQTT